MEKKCIISEASTMIEKENVFLLEKEIRFKLLLALYSIIFNVI